jgi:hypothetical protein
MPRMGKMAASTLLHEDFPRNWQAEILSAPPLIAPARHHVYPRVVEEIERGALQVLLRAGTSASPALLTFARGFAEPSLPHGLWTCPNPAQLCAACGGYVYLVDTEKPENFLQLPYRPVTAIHAAPHAGLLLFAGFHTLWALGAGGPAWESKKLSWEGIRITRVEGWELDGFGWDLMTDREVPFRVDLRSGANSGGIAPPG